MKKLRICRIITALCCCILCFGAIGVAAAEPSADDVAASLEQGVAVNGVVSAFPGATLWAGPSADSSALARVVVNTAVTVSAVENGLYRVTTYDGRSGYMQPSSVKLSGQVPTTSQQAVTNNTGVNLRSGAGTEFSAVRSMPYATALTILGSATGSDGSAWYQVTTADGTGGFVRSDLVTVLTVGSGVLAGKIIVIDPGHGYNRTALYDGAVGNLTGIKEKDINLSVANKLRDKLEALGATVVLTRETDRGALSLTDRAVVANDLGAAAFVSIHCNSADSTAAQGTETFYYPLTAAQKKADYIAAQRAAGNIPADVPNSEVEVPEEYTRLTAAEEALNVERKALAGAVQNGMMATMQRPNRGVKNNEMFTVIKATTVPGVLVELAFLSNEEEEALLSSAAFQSKAAEGIKDGLVEYLT